MRARVLLLALVASCGDGVKPANPPGPPPAADHQELVRAKVQEILDGKDPAGTPTGFRFGAPATDRVARWHFGPETARTHDLGYYHGWRVDYWYTPEYEGYPEQPERHEMAFFGDGRLVGIFAEGRGDAPLGLDKWHADWVDRSWRPVPRK